MARVAGLCMGFPTGGGTAILILKVLQFLRGQRYADVVGLTDRLRQHASRYVRERNTLRTGVFLRQLAVLASSDFDPTIVQERALAIQKRYPEVSAVRRDDAEIVPYEDLWRFVIELLER